MVAERPVARHDVPDIRVEQPVDRVADQTVSEAVETPFILLKICGGKPVADHHIRLPVKDILTHGGSGVSGIGGVTIHHQVALGIDLPEHAADHIAFALFVFVADDRTGFGGDGGGIIRAVVVVHIDHRVRQLRTEAGNDLPDRCRFVEAGNKDCDFIHVNDFPLFMVGLNITSMGKMSNKKRERLFSLSRKDQNRGEISLC